MIFRETTVPGAFWIDPQPVEDERGFFARTWCREELRAHGLDMEIAQCSVSFNRRRGTLRGMHYQAPPREEAKLVRCIRGAIYDVVLDLRPHSSGFGRWAAAELSATNRIAAYVPKGCAHGFQTLEDDTEIEYMISEPYSPELSRGIRWDDPGLGIQWPLANPIVSPRDAKFPLYAPKSE